MPTNNIQGTSDGSHTIFSEKFDALYHSKHGAIQESQHVFIESGLKYLKRDQVAILEMGFGTGLNALLTYDFAAKNNLQIEYHTVEAYPIEAQLANQLNYADELGNQELHEILLKLHNSSWNKQHEFGHLRFKKYLSLIETTTFNRQFDLVYYDAFAPLTQEELWTEDIFRHLRKFLYPNAVLVSYCCKGTFKRALKAAGFEIEKIAGPPGKREMIRAFYKGT